MLQCLPTDCMSDCVFLNTVCNQQQIFATNSISLPFITVGFRKGCDLVHQFLKQHSDESATPWGHKVINIKAVSIFSFLKRLKMT